MSKKVHNFYCVGYYRRGPTHTKYCKQAWPEKHITGVAFIMKCVMRVSQLEFQKPIFFKKKGPFCKSQLFEISKIVHYRVKFGVESMQNPVFCCLGGILFRYCMFKKIVVMAAYFSGAPGGHMKTNWNNYMSRYLLVNRWSIFISILKLFNLTKLIQYKSHNRQK